MFPTLTIKKVVGTAIMAVFIVGCATRPVRTLPDSLSGAENRQSPHSKLLSEYLASTGSPSVAAALVDSTGVQWAESRGTNGYGSRTPVDSATVYRIASLSKVFTALAVYNLSVNGSIDLDSGVEKILPEFRVRCIEERCASITIRQLLTHSSGLPRGELFTWYPAAGPMLLEKVAQVVPVYPPGSRTSYSNLGYAILGEIAARASGTDFRTYITEKILAPLGMRSTGFVPRDTMITNRALGHSVPGMRPLFQPLNEADGGMYSSLDDLSRFTTWLLAGARLPHGDAGSIALFDSLMKPYRPTLALPEDLHSPFGRIRINHGRSTPYKTGFIDGYASGIFLDLEKRVGVIALSNRDLGMDNLGLDLLNHYTGVPGISTGLPEGMPSRSSRANSLEDLKAFQGDYVLGIDYPVPVIKLKEVSNGLSAKFRNQTVYSHSVDDGWVGLRLTRKWDRHWLFFKKEYPVESPALGFFTSGNDRYVSMRGNAGVDISAEPPRLREVLDQGWKKRIGTWENGAGYAVEILMVDGLLYFKDWKIGRAWQLEALTENLATAGGPCRSQGINMEVREDGSIDYRMGIILTKRASK